MPRYNHALFLGFSVISDHPKGEYIAPAVNRLNSISDSELGEACLPPSDTYEEEEDLWIIGHPDDRHSYWGLDGWGPMDRAIEFTKKQKNNQVGNRSFNGEWVRSPNVTH